MTLPPALLCPLIALSLLIGCQSPGERPARAPRPQPQVQLRDRPQSSLLALVRMLEALDALQTPAVEVRIRALECDSLPSRRSTPPHVRVVLGLTFYAADYALAEEAQQALLDGLQEEGRARNRTSMIASHRIRRVFDEMPWNAPKVHSDRDFEGLVSISNTLHIEVYDAGDRQEARPLQGEDQWSMEASSSVEQYIEDLATAEHLKMGPLQVDLSRKRLRDQRTDLNYHIQPLRQGDAFGRHQIAAFLFGLESGSPGVRITHLEISPADPGQDLRHDLWSFGADLTLRISGGR